MHLVVYDATGHGAARVQPFLTASWRIGTGLYKHHPQRAARVDDVYGATSWEDALAWLCSVRPRERIDSVQYWGHGFYGRAYVGSDILDVDALSPGAARHDDLLALRGRVAGEQSLFWFRTCSTFATERGQQFARAWTRFFGCRAAGHTFVIGPLQSGLHTLSPDAEPSWSTTEGVGAGLRRRAARPAEHRPEQRPEDIGADKYGDERVALSSSWTAPNTITCLQGAIPAGW